VNVVFKVFYSDVVMVQIEGGYFIFNESLQWADISLIDSSLAMLLEVSSRSDNDKRRLGLFRTGGCV